MLAEKPENESARLRDLHAYKVLDTAPEADFDDVVGLLSRLLQVPVALVSLVDTNRQWFKARVGLNVDETPLDQSICAHAILQDDLLEIRDTSEDPRTKHNPLCCGAVGEMRFYAGMPLVTPSGHRLGTLCVLDTRPRTLSDLDRETLRVMAAQVMRQLDLRRALTAESVMRDEIDHRVKNSLQTVESLVRLYRARTRSDETREVLDAVARRINAVSELHGALYRTERHDAIALDSYLEKVVELLSRQAPDGVTVESRLVPMRVAPDAAQAVAVIVSEFAANSFKHAFPAGGPGRVDVRLTEDESGMVLDCADNGAVGGAPQPGGTGIGKRLMEAAADQLGGRLDIRATSEGYRLRLALPSARDAAAA